MCLACSGRAEVDCGRHLYKATVQQVKCLKEADSGGGAPQQGGEWAEEHLDGHVDGVVGAVIAERYV